ncbi:phosphate ABC transporter substrate-binding protein [Methylosinus sp. H3A]|nr:phosphate ABC transporter substrate-binding protein [Methylosinus sp. H3A]
MAAAGVVAGILSVLPDPHVRAAESKITLSGSSTVAPLAAEIGRRFEENNPGVRVDVQSGGSSRGVADARSGLADIGMASRATNPDESDLQFFTIARDGIGVIVHKSNSVRSLTDEQIAGIYVGKIADWSAVGGKPGRITVVNKAEGRSTLELFLQYFKLKNSDIKAQVVIGDNQQGIKTVAGNPKAIGYVSIGSAERAGPASLDSSPRILSGSLPRFAERGAFANLSRRREGVARPEARQIRGDDHAAITASPQPK